MVAAEKTLKFELLVLYEEASIKDPLLRIANNVRRGWCLNFIELEVTTPPPPLRNPDLTSSPSSYVDVLGKS